MTSLTRWDPFREATSLHDAMNQLLEQAVLRPGFAVPGRDLVGGLGGQVNVIEANGKYYCQFVVPGVSPDHLDLTVRQNTLMLKARIPETLPEDIRKSGTYLVREFGAGEFTRTVTFPKDVNADDVEAHFTDGILTIEVPLAQHAQPRRISIQAGQSSKTTPLVEAPNATPEKKAQAANTSAERISVNGRDPVSVS